jgi:mannosyltransferase OCH1-like enzyme
MKELSKTPLIPKKIHYCWYGPNKKSQRIQDCIKSWEKILKGYEIIGWDEGNTPFKEIPVLRRL